MVNIDFLDSASSRLYGLARNRKTLMRSDDWGLNWCAVTEAEYLQAEAGVSGQFTMGIVVQAFN